MSEINTVAHHHHIGIWNFFANFSKCYNYI